MFNQTTLYIVLIVVGVLLLYWCYRKNFKRINTPSVCLITGGVKCGKSLLSVILSTIDFKKRHFKWWLGEKILKKGSEEPLYYTNVFVTFGNMKHKHYIKDVSSFDLNSYGIYKDDKGYYYFSKLDKCIRCVNTDNLLRLSRFNYKSVIYIQESSLMADSMDIKDKVRNVDLSLFAKLIAHETRGGAMYLDTQSPLDNHYSFKRVSSTYFFIQKNINFGLFHILYVREMINNENGVNDFNDDLDTTTRKVLIPFWYHNKYDRYEYSYLTDSLRSDMNSKFELKKGLVSFNPLYIERSDKREK